MGVPTIEAVQGDITAQDTEAIVNAANRQLAGGGGVDGAIHRAAGRANCTCRAPLGGCEPGDAKATEGFALRARWIIHTVGPVWGGGRAPKPEVLASCYRRSLEVADELGRGPWRFRPSPPASTAIRPIRPPGWRCLRSRPATPP